MCEISISDTHFVLALNKSSIAIYTNDLKFVSRKDLDYQISSFVLSKDAKYIAITSADKHLHILSTDAYQLVHSFPLKRECFHLVWDSNFIFYTSTGELHKLDPEIDEDKLVLGHIAGLTALTIGFSLIIVGDRDGRIRVSPLLQSFIIKSVCFFHDEFITSIVFVSETEFIASDGDGQISKWNVDGTLIENARLFPEKKIILDIAFNECLYLIVEGFNQVFLVEKTKIVQSIDLKSQPISLAVVKGKVLVGSVGGFSVIENHEAREVEKVECNFTFSKENLRVNLKNVIRKETEGDLFEMWRHPEIVNEKRTKKKSTPIQTDHE